MSLKMQILRAVNDKMPVTVFLLTTQTHFVKHFLRCKSQKTVVVLYAMNSTYGTPAGCKAHPVTDLLLAKNLQQISPPGQAFLIFLIVVNILTFPLTAVLNALVMISVKMKSRPREHKSNVLLALLALNDFSVGILAQPSFTIVSIIFYLNPPSAYCAWRFLRPVMSFLVSASLLHMVLLSAERYLAMKHPFAYITLVTEGRLLIASALIWLLFVFQRVLSVLDIILISRTNSIFIILSIGLIVYCHITVYNETRRHEKQLASQQVTQEARQQFERDRKAFKLTSIILAVLFLCFLPGFISALVLTRLGTEVKTEARYLLHSFSVSIVFMNSLLNPIIYSVRIRQFRVAFIELLFRTVNIAQAEQIEMRFFGATNVVGPVVGNKAEEDEQGNMINHDNPANRNELLLKPRVS